MATSSSAEAISLGQSINQNILNATREEFRKSHPCATGPSPTGKPYDKVVVGAAAFQYSSGSSFPNLPRILLLERAPHEVYFPNIFELPSGKVDPEDPTIKHALIREVKEETGLDVIEILAELKPMIYTTERMVVDKAGRDVLISKSAIQLNYVVSISEGDVKLSAEEHSESTWATEAELDGLSITTDMRAVVQEAFTWAANKLLVEKYYETGLAEGMA
jgi:8-oxo-dGTP pyrophosphatase MutT (NUDIX family)